MATTQAPPPAAETSSAAEVPLIINDGVELKHDAVLDKVISRLEILLKIFGFCQYSLLSTILSWVAFGTLAVALPLLRTWFSYCASCEEYEIETFEFDILVFQFLAAAVSLLCISHNLRKYGLRKLLLVDRYHGHISQFRQQYIQKIKVFYRILAKWVIICFFLKTARELGRMIYLHDSSWWQSIIILIFSLLSWTYTTVVFLLGVALFHLVGNLQMIHFENYGTLLERDLDVSVYIEEHMRLTYYLSKISHRFRMFLLLEFVIVSSSQFVALLQTTGNKSIINFINAGNFAVLSIVQLVGLFLCLAAAAKLSHRAQALGSIASRWHALVTCNSSETSLSSVPANGGNMYLENTGASFCSNYSESDLESADYIAPPTNIQLTSNMSSYHKRQAFVNYVQSNTGGFTVFGWMVDRVLMTTVFFIEFSLVCFALGMTTTITTR